MRGEIHLQEASNAAEARVWVASMVDRGEKLWVVGAPLERAISQHQTPQAQREVAKGALSFGDRHVVNLWFVTSDRLTRWLTVNDAPMALVEQRIGAATREMLASTCPSWDGTFRVALNEQRDRPMVQAVLAARPGARLLSKGVIQDLEAAWDRALHRHFGIAAPVRNTRGEPGGEKADRALATWWQAQSEYREAVFQRYRAVSPDALWRSAWSASTKAEHDYFALSGTYERARFGMRTEYPETRIELQGAARYLERFTGQERRQVLEVALHELLPYQQLYVMHAMPTARHSEDLQLVVHQFVPLIAGERARLTERLPTALWEVAREMAPDRVHGEVGVARLSDAYSLHQKGFDLLSRTMPPGMARSLGRGFARMERAGRLE